MTIKEIKKNNEIILQIEGRIDTNTSAVLQDKVLKSLQKSSYLTLDLTETDYVSSAGLRTFLIAYKTAVSKGGSFQLCNVSENVLRVLKESGFSKLLKIE